MHEFTWFGWISGSVNHHNIHVITGIFVSSVIILLAYLYHRGLQLSSGEIVPNEKVGLGNIFQVAVESIYSLVEGVIGKSAKLYFPLIASLFIYIFLNNILGIVPGFLPATDNINTTVALGITVFVYYNFIGIRTQGFKNYFKHFLGPVWMMAPLMLVIELISHCVRPMSLGIRLFGNMTGDHVVLGIFSDLVPLLVPVLFLGLGVFVSFIQAFVFSLLTSVYIGLAVAHEEH